jgi:Ser/Thr protein kinase RdoA (MazF antagonist)
VKVDIWRVAKKPEPPKTTSWDVYKIAEKAVWLGTVEAPDKQSAIEKAAVEFNVDASRQYAMGRR